MGRWRESGLQSQGHGIETREINRRAARRAARQSSGEIDVLNLMGAGFDVGRGEAVRVGRPGP